MSTVNRFDPRALYSIYRVTVQFREWLCGGMPRNKELIRAWVEASTGHADEKTEKLIQEDAELVVNEVAEKVWQGFPEDAHGLFVPTRQVKALLKQSASLLGITKTKRGSKQILAEGLEVKALHGGERLHLGLKVPSGTYENAIHVMTAQGPRTALRRMDYVEQPALTFEVWVLGTAPQETRHIGEKELVAILQHAQENGLGASRSQGYGKFNVTKFEVVQTVAPKAEKSTATKEQRAEA